MATADIPSTEGTPTVWQGANNSRETNNSGDATANATRDIGNIISTKKPSATVGTAATAETPAIAGTPWAKEQKQHDRQEQETSGTSSDNSNSRDARQ
jgi:hypothetical protein